MADLCNEVVVEGRRPILWGDSLLCYDTFGGKQANVIDECNAKNEETALQLIKALPKEAIVADWHYGITTERWISTEFLKKQGLTVMTCPWTDYPNICGAINTTLQLDGLGVIQTTWDKLKDMWIQFYITHERIYHKDVDILYPYQKEGLAARTILRKVYFAGNYQDAGSMK